MTWENFGYPTILSCVVCDSRPCKVEPRFGYAVCEEHHKIAPAWIQHARELLGEDD